MTCRRDLILTCFLRKNDGFPDFRLQKSFHVLQLLEYASFGTLAMIFCQFWHGEVRENRWNTG